MQNYKSETTYSGASNLEFSVRISFFVGTLLYFDTSGILPIKQRVIIVTVIMIITGSSCGL